MGAKLRTVRRRIRSVQSTMKITRAMELIAASRILKAQQRVAEARPFAERLLEQPAPEWPRWLARAVAKTKPGDFAIRPSAVERSLDLVVVARPL